MERAGEAHEGEKTQGEEKHWILENLVHLKTFSALLDTPCVLDDKDKVQ
mgnify:CR=1 FL=1